MQLDNDVLVPMGPWQEALAEGVVVATGIGGGIGAKYAFASGTLTGSAFITAGSAAVVGVVAAAYAGARIGNLIGETDLVKELILDAFEAISPIDQPDPNAWIEEVLREDGSVGMDIIINDDRASIEFYVDNGTYDAFDFQNGIDSNIEYYTDPMEAVQEQLRIIGSDDDVWSNTCGSGIVPVVEL